MRGVNVAELAALVVAQPAALCRVAADCGRVAWHGPNATISAAMLKRRDVFVGAVWRWASLALVLALSVVAAPSIGWFR